MTYSTYGANHLGDHARGRTSYTMPTTALALYTSSPGVGGTAVTNEVAYGGYARVPCGTGAGSVFSAASSGSSNNASGAISFPALTSGGPVTITYVGIVDSTAGAGNLIEFGALSASVTYNNAQTPSFNTGTLTDLFT